ncbi:TPA: hypothetical protein ACX6R8_003496 [Photobacterium damselae]
MKNIYLVESPLQLLSALEVSKKNRNNHLIINLSNNKDRIENLKQLTLLYNDNIDNWDSIIKLSLTNSPFLNVIILLYYTILFYFKLGKNCNVVFNGDFKNLYFSLWSKFLAKKKCEYIIDDGVLTITLQQMFFEKNKGIYSINRSSKFKRMIVKIYSFLLFLEIDDTPPNLCSIFKFRENKFNSQMKMLHSINKRHKKKLSEIYFLGSPYSEAGIIDINTEIRLLNDIKNFFMEKNDYEFYYISHRDDSLEKITLLENNDIKIIKLGMPCEKYFDESNVIPKVIASFLSTSLYTLGTRYSFDSIISFDFMKYISDRETLERVYGLYTYYKKSNIKVIKI